MALNSNKTIKNLTLLVANRSVMEPDKACGEKFEAPYSKEADGIYFIDEDDDFNKTISKMVSS